MSTQIAEFELTQPCAPDVVVARTTGDEVQRQERPLSVARGIVAAVLIATPFWVLFAFALYLLI